MLLKRLRHLMDNHKKECAEAFPPTLSTCKYNSQKNYVNQKFLRMNTTGWNKVTTFHRFFRNCWRLFPKHIVFQQVPSFQINPSSDWKGSAFSFHNNLKQLLGAVTVFLTFCSKWILRESCKQSLAVHKVQTGISRTCSSTMQVFSTYL